MEIISAAGAKAAGVIISLDREERGQETLSAVEEVKKRFNIPVFSIVTLCHIVEFLEATGDFGAELTAIARYRSRYGT